MMRLACFLATERGIEVRTPVHDALLVQAPVEAIDDVRCQTVQCMAEASATVLHGPPLKIGVESPVIYPDHFSEERGEEVWQQLMNILSEVER